MPNSPDINKTQLVVRLERGLKLQLEKEATEQQMTTTKLVNRILHEELSHVELTAEDYRKIADEIEKDKRRRKLRN
jgi:uncharacterized membrane protein